jgi:Flp pilus assembly CpaE family ATPase
MQAQSISVLLVEDNADDAQLVREMLAETGEAISVRPAARLSEALTQVTGGEIDVVLLDLSLPDSAGLDTYRKLRQAAPRLPVLILSGNEDEAMALSAVRDGAQDYLLKGRLPAPALLRCIRYALARQRQPQRAESARQPQKRGKIFSFLGAKGGVGTTTVALNMASALAWKFRVIAVELHSYSGAFAHQLRCRETGLPDPLELDAAEIGETALRKQLCTLPSGLRVLYGPRPGELRREVRAATAEAILDGLGSMGDYVVVDLPCEPCEATRAALRRSDLVVLVVEREPCAVQAARTALPLLRSWTPAMIVTVLVNRAVMANPLPLPEIVLQLGPIMAVVPPDPEMCMLAQAAGTPLVLHRPESNAAMTLRRLAERLTADPIQVREP